MVEYGTNVARGNGYTNLEYRLGGIEDPPIEAGSVDLAFLSSRSTTRRAPRPPSPRRIASSNRAGASSCSIC